MCIAIRTLLATPGRVSVQSGAGIVYDSDPAAEYQETVNKARAVFTAVAQAQGRALHAPPILPPSSVAAGRRRRKPGGAPRPRCTAARRPATTKRGGRP
jgi:anthranilate synthase component I